ncbi:MAG: T9SS type A sorting domain-containing protein [Adhaeribacter sp.]
MNASVTSRGLFLICLFITQFFALPTKAFSPESAELTFHSDTTNTWPLRYFFKLVYYTPKTLTVPDGLPIAYISFSDGTPDESVIRSSRAALTDNPEMYREVYYFEHQFPATGTFTVSFKEINRRIDYVNIANREDIAFVIQATVKIDPTVTANRSPVFMAPVIFTGVIGQPYRHNVTAYDPDGDSLVYKLVPAMQNRNAYIPSYQFPVGATINSQTGEFIWPAPDKTGRHSVVVEIWEYRQEQLIGKVMREILVLILPAGVNPLIEIRNRSQVPVNNRNQVFITSDEPVKIRVAATHANTLTAYSELFSRANSITTFPTSDNPPEIEYTIKPDASLRRNLPYIITFRGTAPPVVTGISQQQDLTLAVYFRPEQVTDQENASKFGEIPIFEPDTEPDNADETLTFKVYPNPVEFYFYIDNKKNIPATLSLYNVQNQLVLTQPLTLAQTFISRSSTLVAGMYFYTIISEAGKIEQSGRLVFR